MNHLPWFLSLSIELLMPLLKMMATAASVQPVPFDLFFMKFCRFCKTVGTNTRDQDLALTDLSFTDFFQFYSKTNTINNIWKICIKYDRYVPTWSPVSVRKMYTCRYTYETNHRIGDHVSQIGLHAFAIAVQKHSRLAD